MNYPITIKENLYFTCQRFTNGVYKTFTYEKVVNDRNASRHDGHASPQ